MFISAQKKRENAIEYLLYMWQIEDLIRSCQFNIDQIYNKVIKNTSYNLTQQQELKNWYMELMYVMERENIQEKGHMSDLLEVQESLNQLHTQLLSIYQNASYQKIYAVVSPYIKELKQKTNESVEHDVDVALEFMYGTLLLQLQKKTMGDQTKEALKYISHLMFSLADFYQDQKQGFLSFSKAQKN